MATDTTDPTTTPDAAEPVGLAASVARARQHGRPSLADDPTVAGMIVALDDDAVTMTDGDDGGVGVAEVPSEVVEAVATSAEVMPLPARRPTTRHHPFRAAYREPPPPFPPNVEIGDLPGAKSSEPPHSPMGEYRPVPEAHRWVDSFCSLAELAHRDRTELGRATFQPGVIDRATAEAGRQVEDAFAAALAAFWSGAVGSKVVRLRQRVRDLRVASEERRKSLDGAKARRLEAIANEACSIDALAEIDAALSACKRQLNSAKGLAREAEAGLRGSEAQARRELEPLLIQAGRTVAQAAEARFNEALGRISAQVAQEVAAHLGLLEVGRLCDVRRATHVAAHEVLQGPRPAQVPVPEPQAGDA
jgi:hypothetical protein